MFFWLGEIPCCEERSPCCGGSARMKQISSRCRLKLKKALVSWALRVCQSFCWRTNGWQLLRLGNKCTNRDIRRNFYTEVNGILQVASQVCRDGGFATGSQRGSYKYWVPTGFCRNLDLARRDPTWLDGSLDCPVSVHDRHMDPLGTPRRPHGLSGGPSGPNGPPAAPSDPV